MSFFNRRGLQNETSQPETPQATLTSDPFDLDNPLLYFTPQDAWTIRDGFEGVQIFGSIGSGKSSGSGATIARSFLQAGFGGLVLTAKPDERAQWEQYAKETGRSESLIIFSPQTPYRFNFLDYELKRPGSGAGLTENLVNLFMTVMESAETGSGGGGNNEQYWNRTLKQLLRNTIDLLSIAKGAVSLPLMYDVITSAPTDAKQLHTEDWRKRSLCFACIRDGKIKEKMSEPGFRQADFSITCKYWLNEFPNLADRTRSIIVSTFTSLADAFLRGTLRELFCTKTNIVPELTHEGVILVIDLPVKEYMQLGQFAQVLFKYIWQQATERRDVTKKPRPVFLWIDESQLFLTSYDQVFQTTARSSRACTVLLSQNISNYYVALGDHARSQADSLLGNLNTKIFHANTDSVTNEWASELIARSWQNKKSISTTAMQDGTRSRNVNVSESFEWQVSPREFTVLRKGGVQNNLEVEGIVVQGGRVFKANDKPHLKAVFKQV